MPKVYTLVDVEDGGEYHMTLPMILEYINEGRGPDWANYDETDWREGLAEFTTLEVQDAKLYEVTRSYTVAEVYYVEAENEEEAYDAACRESPDKVYDGDYDSEYEVMEILNNKGKRA